MELNNAKGRRGLNGDSSAAGRLEGCWVSEFWTNGSEFGVDLSSRRFLARSCLCKADPVTSATSLPCPRASDGAQSGWSTSCRDDGLPAKNEN